VALGNIARTSRKAQRLTEIALVLVRHGFSHFVHRLNLHRYLPRAHKLAARAERRDEETLAHRLSLVMEELGPTFVKLGQMLSTRPDLLPESFVNEFRRFQDHVAPFSGDEARAVVERELGGPIEQLFQSFSDHPLASGSLAQVHGATLSSGQQVAVKVKRPGIERTVLTDVELLKGLARYAERHVAEMQVYRPVLVIDELHRSIRRELEFITEASYTSKFHQALADLEGVRTPAVCWDLTTSNVLTLERLDGFNIGDGAQIDRRGIDRRKLTAALVAAFMRMYFELGLFHADPHPGNLLVQEDGTLAIIDFGNSGHLAADLKGQIATLLIALVRADTDIVLQQMADLGMFQPGADRQRLKGDIMELLDRYYGMPLKRLDTRMIFADLARVARENQVLLPREFIGLARSFVMVTSTAKAVDPGFNLAAAVEPYAAKLLREKFSPRGALKSLALTFYTLSRLMQKLPTQLADIVRKMDAGTWQILFKHEGLENLFNEMDRVTNRVAISIILGAIVIGSSLIMHARLWPTIGSLLGAPGGGPDLSILGLIGFLVAGVLGLWLVWDILRSGRY